MIQTPDPHNTFLIYHIQNKLHYITKGYAELVKVSTARGTGQIRCSCNSGGVSVQPLQSLVIFLRLIEKSGILARLTHKDNLPRGSAEAALQRACTHHGCGVGVSTSDAANETLTHDANEDEE